jgi:hypothetical protein
VGSHPNNWSAPRLVRLRYGSDATYCIACTPKLLHFRGAIQHLARLRYALTSSRYVAQCSLFSGWRAWHFQGWLSWHSSLSQCMGSPHVSPWREKSILAYNLFIFSVVFPKKCIPKKFIDTMALTLVHFPVTSPQQDVDQETEATGLLCRCAGTLEAAYILGCLHLTTASPFSAPGMCTKQSRSSECRSAGLLLLASFNRPSPLSALLTLHLVPGQHGMCLPSTF